MISKLLIIRKKYVSSDLLTKHELTSLVVGEPLPIKPMAWREEDGLSHYGYVLNMKLKEFKKVEQLLYANGAWTLLDLDPDDAKDALAKVGLELAPSGDE